MSSKIYIPLAVCALVLIGCYYHVNAVSGLELEIKRLNAKHSESWSLRCSHAIDQIAALHNMLESVKASQAQSALDVSAALKDVVHRAKEVVTSAPEPTTAAPIVRTYDEQVHDRLWREKHHIKENNNMVVRTREVPCHYPKRSEAACDTASPQHPYVRPVKCFFKLATFPQIVVALRKDCADPLMLRECNTIKDIMLVANHLGLAKNAVVLGIRDGYTSHKVLQHWEGRKVWLVDPYEKGTAASLQALHAKLSSVSEKYEILRNDTEKSASAFLDESVDLVVFDAALTYRALWPLLEAWYPKLRDTGLMVGHDYTLKVHDDSTVSVKDAVDHFAQVYEMRVHTTRDSDEASVTKSPTWYMQRLCAFNKYS